MIEQIVHTIIGHPESETGPDPEFGGVCTCGGRDHGARTIRGGRWRRTNPSVRAGAVGPSMLSVLAIALAFASIFLAVFS